MKRSKQALLVAQIKNNINSNIIEIIKNEKKENNNYFIYIYKKK